MLWCRGGGFSTSLEKTEQERRSELALRHRQTRPKRSDKHDPERADLIKSICAGERDEEWLPHTESRIRKLFKEVEKVEGGREALLRLLLRVESDADLFSCQAGCGHGPSYRNQLISGLSELARHHAAWVREPEAWKPSSEHRSEQFSELAAHLFARYPVPRCLLVAWFEPNPAEAAIQQEWYVHVGRGGNIRTAAGLPFRLTKRTAHEFMTSDDRYDPLAGLRVSQIRAMDPDVHRKLVWGLGWDDHIRGRKNADFWTSVIQFFVNNSMLESQYIGPTIDYIHHMKFEPQRVPEPNGGVRVLPPKHPRFAVKARSMAKLVREVDDWHSQLSAVVHDKVEEWDSSGIAGFMMTEENSELKNRIEWTIQELCNTALLQLEGRVMGHCVPSYAKRCAAGEFSIWSLRSRVDAEEAEQHHVLTIAVENKKRLVTEARGKFNMQPHRRPSKKQGRRIQSNYRVALRESARIMAIWRQKEGLRAPRRLPGAVRLNRRPHAVAGVGVGRSRCDTGFPLSSAASPRTGGDSSVGGDSSRHAGTLPGRCRRRRRNRQFWPRQWQTRRLCDSRRGG